MREAVPWEQDRFVVAAAVLASGRGWAVLVQPMTDAEATAQMIRVLNMEHSSLIGDLTSAWAYGSTTLFKLVARALHRVEFRASQKGSQDKYLGVCAMALTVEKKGGIVAQFRRDTSDTGSPEVQVALLSERINGLGEHFTAHKRDHSSRRGLVKLVNQRRKLLDYLKSTQPQKYQELVERLGLRR
jgi:small subunit ribosomal protein S15